MQRNSEVQMPESKHRKKKPGAASKPGAGGSWIGTGNGQGKTAFFGSNNLPDNPIFHHMKTADMFSAKTKVRTDMLSYLEPFAHDEAELTAFAVATSTYFLQADGGDPTMILKTLRQLAKETETGRVPYLDKEGGDMADKEADEWL